MSQEVDSSLEQATLLDVHLQVGTPQTGEDFFEPTQIGVKVSAEYYYVVQIDEAGLVGEATKHQVH